jgi:hypothetical protein
VIEAGCEARTGRTPGPSDVAEERGGDPALLGGTMISRDRTLEKLGPALYSPECVEGNSRKSELYGASSRASKATRKAVILPSST